jgi:hypothetical protein
MMKRILTSAALALVVAACSSGTVPTAPAGVPTVPGGLPTGVPTLPPVGTPGNPPPNGGNLESQVRSLVPPGSTEVQSASLGGSFSVTVTNPGPLDQLEAFWDQTIPAVGVTQTGKVEAGGTLTYGFTDPDGGIVAAPNGSGGYVITVSLGIT